MLVDVHAHLDFKEFDSDRNEVINEAKKAGVVKIITSGLNQKTNENALELSKKYGIVEASLGLYPIDMLKLNGKQISSCLEFIKKHSKEIVGIGEVGLDYQESQDKITQKKNFQQIISLAESLNLPIIVHSRKAESDVIEMLESSKIKKVVLHCFSGNMKLVKKASDLNYNFSIPCNILFSNHFKTLVENVPLKQLLTETDCPYLSPIKGQRNEPKYIGYTINEIAKLKKLTEEETKKIIFMNYQRIFSL
ncbi:MAG: TatD family hydrolase [Candidatus Nanoarchaeia archaeon]|nr:TatD family hydrolase [Candidatus Nanoarchaeia archaeon]